MKRKFTMYAMSRIRINLCSNLDLRLLKGLHTLPEPLRMQLYDKHSLLFNHCLEIELALQSPIEQEIIFCR